MLATEVDDNINFIRRDNLRARKTRIDLGERREKLTTFSPG